MDRTRTNTQKNPVTFWTWPHTRDINTRLGMCSSIVLRRSQKNRQTRGPSLWRSETSYTLSHCQLHSDQKGGHGVCHAFWDKSIKRHATTRHHIARRVMYKHALRSKTDVRTYNYIYTYTYIKRTRRIFVNAVARTGEDLHLKLALHLTNGQIAVQAIHPG